MARQAQWSDSRSCGAGTKHLLSYILYSKNIELKITFFTHTNLGLQGHKIKHVENFQKWISWMQPIRDVDGWLTQLEWLRSCDMLLYQLRYLLKELAEQLSIQSLSCLSKVWRTPIEKGTRKWNRPMRTYIVQISDQLVFWKPSTLQTVHNCFYWRLMQKRTHKIHLKNVKVHQR